jgi:DNA-binding transcriptional LysR family regulator
MVAEDIRLRRLKVVLPAYRPTGLEVYAVYPSRRNMPIRVKLFLEFLRDRCLNTPEWQAETARAGHALRPAAFSNREQ